jgi:hypothetical protein
VDNYDPSVFNFVKCNSTYDLKCDDGKCYNKLTFNGTAPNCSATLGLNSTGWWNPVYPSENYWNQVILQKSDGIDASGTVIWQLVLALFIGWVIVFAMVVKGIKVCPRIE